MAISKSRFDTFAIAVLLGSILFFTPYKKCWGDHMEFCRYLGWDSFFPSFTTGSISIDFLRLIIQEVMLITILYLVRRNKYPKKPNTSSN